MTTDNTMRALIEVLERQQSEFREPSPAASIPEMAPAVHPAQNVRNGDASRFTATNDSLMKARYALTVLRVAQGTEQQTAARLVRGLAHDLPDPVERPEIAEIHLRAID